LLLNYKCMRANRSEENFESVLCHFI
jgi:hypothetical protein